jgi:hypothetical protein
MVFTHFNTTAIVPLTTLLKNKCMRYCWVQNKLGYVVECVHCQQMQIAFGTSCFTIASHQFHHLLANVTKLAAAGNCPHNSCIQKTNFIELPADGYFLGLTPSELQAFYTLLDSADTERKIFNLQQLIQL